LYFVAATTRGETKDYQNVATS